MIRVIIAEDHHLVRQGIRALLEKSPDIEVIGEAATGLEAVEMVETHKPEVIILDISMPRLDGTQAAERILKFDIPTQIVVLSVHSDTTLVHHLLRQGVKGYLLKNSIADELLLAVRAASQGQIFLSPTISDSVMAIMNSPKGESLPPSPAELLTPREREVLQLIAEGHTNHSIANLLTISPKTVEKHRAKVMTKLETHDLPSLILVAMKHGLIYPDE
ncbi:MAG: response regulator transcription factor [Candidatus Promineifilaceae bacterium]